LTIFDGRKGQKKLDNFEPTIWEEKKQSNNKATISSCYVKVKPLEK
jgi:hypothetical protein